jgi:hypothetical protein
MTFIEQKSWVDLAKEAYNIREERKRIEKIEEELFARLLIESKNEELSAGGFSLSKVIRKGSVDYAQIPVLQGLDLEPYRKAEITTWKLSVVQI